MLKSIQKGLIVLCREATQEETIYLVVTQMKLAELKAEGSEHDDEAQER